MTTRAGLGLALFGLLSSGCYDSGGQTKDGQSHWLAACSVDSECADSELCACGVCTIACSASTSCGAAASCSVTAGRAECSGAAAAVDQVCLASCSPDDGCGAELRCVDGACVGRERDEGDEVIPQIDASVLSEDSGVPDDAGKLEPDAFTPDSLACDDDGACAAGQVCNIEEACVEPGVEDGDGIAVLLGPQVDGFDISTGVSTFQLIDGDVIWMTTELPSFPGTEPLNAYLYRMDLEGRVIELLDGPFPAPALPRIAIEQDHVFYSSREGIRTHRFDEPVGLGWSWDRDDAHRAIWLADEGFFYMVTSPNEVWRMTNEASPEELVFSAGDDVVVRALAADGQSLFVELFDPVMGSSQTRVMQMNKDGSSPVTLIDEFRGTELPSDVLIPEGMFFADGFLISDEDAHTGIQAHSIASGERRALEQAATPASTLVACSASDGYAYYAGSANNDDGSFERFVARASLESGAAEHLHSGSSTPLQVVADAGYVYWSESGRLLRKALPDAP